MAWAQLEPVFANCLSPVDTDRSAAERFITEQLTTNRDNFIIGVVQCLRASQRPDVRIAISLSLSHSLSHHILGRRSVSYVRFCCVVVFQLENQRCSTS